MRQRAIVWFGCAAAVVCTPAAFAQSATATRAPLAVVPAQPLKLEFPEPRFFHFSFDGRTTPGFELLRLPTFRGELSFTPTHWLGLTAFQTAAPALELDCRTVCEPILENKLGLELRVPLGGTRALPANAFVVGVDTARSATGVRFDRGVRLGFRGPLSL